MKNLPFLLMWLVSATVFADSHPAPPAVPIPQHFDSTGSDRRAIETVLANYTMAVSTKNEALFESLLISLAIPFSYIGPAPATGVVSANYAQFRHGVFDGPPFTQRFTDVRITQDGNVASVTLVFINTDAKGESWGWKTLQLLNTTAGWKIASEFFTSH